MTVPSSWRDDPAERAFAAWLAGPVTGALLRVVLDSWVRVIAPGRVGVDQVVDAACVLLDHHRSLAVPAPGVAWNDDGERWLAHGELSLTLLDRVGLWDDVTGWSGVTAPGARHLGAMRHRRSGRRPLDPRCEPGAPYDRDSVEAVAPIVGPRLFERSRHWMFVPPDAMQPASAHVAGELGALAGRLVGFPAELRLVCELVAERGVGSLVDVLDTVGLVGVRL